MHITNEKELEGHNNITKNRLQERIIVNTLPFKIDARVPFFPPAKRIKILNSCFAVFKDKF